jgi:hypothetical protein
MPLFGNWASDRKKRAPQLASDAPKDAKLQEELSELTATENRKELDRADTEVQEVVTQATRADIREIKLIEQGRCPQCKSRTDNFLYTVVCPACGWYRREVPTIGKSIVHLDSGEMIPCDRVYRANDEYLCVRDGVVVSQVLRRYIRRIEYNWEPDELARARDQSHKRRYGVCSWCDKDLAEAEEEGPFEDFVAPGAYQERYIFCSETCMGSFRKRFPSRVHRNCYETECSSCDKCIKKYDIDGFRRHVL